MAKKKSERNSSLIRAELNLNPESAKLHLSLAEALLLGDVVEEGLEHTLEAMKNKDGSLTRKSLTLAHQIVLYTIYMKGDNPGRKQEIPFHYQAAIAVDNRHPDFDIVMGIWLCEQEQWNEGVVYLEQALRKGESKELHSFSRIMEFLNNVYHSLVTAYENLRDDEKCFYYATMSLRIDPYQEELLLPLLHRLSYREHLPAPDIIGFLRKLYDVSKRKDTLFLLKVIKKIRNQELEVAFKPLLFEEDRKLLYPNEPSV